MKKWLVWLVLTIYMALGAVAVAAPSLPPTPLTSNYVQDYAGVLSNETKSKINRLGAKIAGQTEAQIVVVTIDSLQGASIEDYSLALFRQWKIGNKEKNNGVLLLVAVGDRQSRIEVGYGLEGALNDARAGQIQDEYLLPPLSRDDYNRGIWDSYKAIMRVVSAEYGLPVPGDNQAAAPNSNTAVMSWWESLPWWLQGAVAAGLGGLLIVDWLFWGGSLTYLLLSFLRFRSGGGGYGGGSGGGGGANRRW